MSNFPFFKSTACSEYDDFVRSNIPELEIPKTTEINGLIIMNDSIKLYGVRLNGSASLCEEIANTFGFRLPTVLECDQIALAATVKNTPCPQSINCTIDGMIRHSKDVDKTIGGQQGIVLNSGKYWCSGNIPKGKALNYGWFLINDAYSWRGIRLYAAKSKAPKLRVIQCPGLEHSPTHSDYSQVMRFVK